MMMSWESSAPLLRTPLLSVSLSRHLDGLGVLLGGQPPSGLTEAVAGRALGQLAGADTLADEHHVAEVLDSVPPQRVTALGGRQEPQRRGLADKVVDVAAEMPRGIADNVLEHNSFLVEVVLTILWSVSNISPPTLLFLIG